MTSDAARMVNVDVRHNSFSQQRPLVGGHAKWFTTVSTYLQKVHSKEPKAIRSELLVYKVIPR